MHHRPLPLLTLMLALGACGDPDGDPPPAEGVYGRLGTVRPNATQEERDTFARGEAVAMRRFTEEEGLGPLFNVTFCASCHEKPVFGGSGPRYRNFYLIGRDLGDGSFLPAGMGGVLTSHGLAGAPTRPSYDDEDVNVVAHRNPPPFFGVGLIAELPEDVILANVDEDDADGDGISGRANYDRGFVGRFGRKAQTVSLEGFVRGPLNNHLGITSDPLTEAQKASLPVPSASFPVNRQAAAPEEPLMDSDLVPDPELPSQDLFDVIAWTMLLAAPEAEDPTPQTQRGAEIFADANCSGCHVPTLAGPRGTLPLYSDLLIHDMGDGMADGVAQGVATGSEFRTQPLWGVAAGAPYLHDGSADTIDQAIRLHGGEATASRDAYLDLGEAERGDLLAFLDSLGGADQRTPGLLPPDAAVPPPGTPGAPVDLSPDELETWLVGRAAFDRDVYLDEGLGPTFNGDSCRACHFDPVIGGAGPRGLDVIHHGRMEAGDFVAPEGGTILHRLTTPDRPRPEHGVESMVFESRQTPTLLGVGAIMSIPDDELRALEDPSDADSDGVYGVLQTLGDGRVSRLGWKAQVPSTREFVRDAMSAENGRTVPDEAGFTFGKLTDDDEVPDPEISTAEIDAIAFFIDKLAPPQPLETPTAEGLAAFDAAMCGACHVPSLPGAEGPVNLYSDLLLHRVTEDGTIGVADGLAEPGMFRTPPLWGLSATAPYMHDGSASTVRDAIEAHAGEADTSVAAFEVLDPASQAALVEMLERL